MSNNIKAPDAMHFRSLNLENVRAFANRQSLKFVDEHGAISRWNLILGENGVGKTTLMQALAVMRPIPFANAPTELSGETGPPTNSTAALSEAKEDNEITRFIRRDAVGTTTIEAVLETDSATRLEVRVEIGGSPKGLKSFVPSSFPYTLRSEGPLLIGYGAGRHIGHRNLVRVEERSATEALFSDAIDLYDAEELIEKLDHAAKSDPAGADGADARRLEMLKRAIASLLPGGLTHKDIEIRGPRLAGRDPDLCGVHVKTPSGVTPLADLSLGYQTMFALTVDLAWRLFNAFPKSAEPLGESAIVLVDEVDLHLHPRWQRDVRRHLLAHFPKVQFIATTHSPVTAQEALSEGGTVAVVRWVDGEARILNHPIIPRREWRFDQLLVSELFGFGSERSKEAEERLERRLVLIRTISRSVEEEAELRELDKYVATLPTAYSPSAQSFEELMKDFARNLPEGVAR